MFRGVSLSPAQAAAITDLAKGFAAERAALVSGSDPRAPWDAATKVRLMPFVERQRAAYRALLTPAQQPAFDENTARILTRWQAASGIK
jgi:hypothetical protein